MVSIRNYYLQTSISEKEAQAPAFKDCKEETEGAPKCECPWKFNCASISTGFSLVCLIGFVAL